MSTPEMSIPEVNFPEASIPDSSIPDSSIPDSSIPEASMPETHAAETEETAPPEGKKRRKARSKAKADTVDMRPKARLRKREDLARDLVSELDGLKQHLDELVERYRVRVGGRIAELKQRIEGDARLDPKHRPPPARDSGAALELIRGADLKKIARAKDFGRLYDLVDQLDELLPPR